MEDYSAGYLPDYDFTRSQRVREVYPEIREFLMDYLNDQAGNPLLEAPSRLIHGDFMPWNMLFECNGQSMPKLTAIIDWDHAWVGPLYYPCSYPSCIMDESGQIDKWDKNKKLRRHFVRSLAREFPKDSMERKCAHQCFLYKEYSLEFFLSTFLHCLNTSEEEIKLEQSYLDELRKLTTEASTLRLDWKPDTDVDSEEDE